MKQIPTINGRYVSSDQMGLTLIHEHLLFQFEEKHKDQSIEFTRSELKKLSERGGQTLVDLTPFRNIHWYREIAEGIDVHLVACTGYYVQGTVEPLALERSLEEHIAHMEKEITQGIDDTNIRPGIIKVAGSGPLLTQWEESVFTAAAKVQTKTKTPIATHACIGSGEQQRILLNAGANPEHIFFSHVEAKFGWEERTVKEQAQYLLEIAKKGSYLLFNNFGFEFDTPKDELIYILKYLSTHGYQDKILISVDMNYQVNKEGNIILEAADRYSETSKRVYSYLISDVIPTLKEEGFSQQDVDLFFIHNPARFFDYA